MAANRRHDRSSSHARLTSAFRCALQEAMDWYQQHSVTGQQLPAISAIEEEPSDHGVFMAMRRIVHNGHDC